MMRTIDAHKRATSDALASQLDDLIASASDLLDNLNEQRSDTASALRSRATRNIEGARRRLNDLKRQVPESAGQAARAAARYAQRNPWSAVAAGTLVVGAVAALLYMSTSRR
jgi:ElaB/YqjD/DUF883 family membrane-anchored ribosome-binding protein